MSRNTEEDRFDLQIRSAMEGAQEPVPEHIWAAISDRLDAAGQPKAVPFIPIWLRRTAIGLAAAAAIALGVFLFVPRHSVSEDDRIAVVESTDINGGVPASQDTIQSAVQSNATAFDNPSTVQNSTSAFDNPFKIHSIPSPADIPFTFREIHSDDTAAALSGEEASEDIPAEDLAVPEADGEDLESQLAAVSGYLADALDNGNEGLAGRAEDESSAPALSESMEPESRSSYPDPWNDPFADDATTRSRGKIRTAVTMSGNALSNAGSASSSSQSGIHRQMVSSIVQQTTEGLTENSESSYGIPASFGVGVKIIFTPRWSLGVGVNYSLLSRTFSGTYTSYSPETDSYTSTNYSKIRHSLNYIGIPVNAYFSIVKSHIVDFYAYAGGTVEKAVSNRYTLENDGIYRDPVKGLQFSADIGIGVEFIIADMVGIYIDPSLRYYFPNSTQPTSIRTQEPLNFGFEIGFRIRL